MFHNGSISNGNAPHRNNRIGHRHYRKRGNKRMLADCEQETESNELLDGDTSDPRSAHPSPSVPWCDEVHREFVKAVFQIGIEQSSPAVIAEEMITKNSYNSPASSNPEPPSFWDRKVAEWSGSSHSAPAHGIGRKKALAEYYKRELTGERLKSHLQKLRKQKDKEIDLFLEEYDSNLAKEKSLDRLRKEVDEREAKRRENARENRLRKKRQRPPNLLEPVEWGINVCDDRSCQLDPTEASRVEEERLLSLYLPLRVAGNDRNGNEDAEDDEQGSKSLFPAGGNAIGKLTWAVQKDLQSRRKSKKDGPVSAFDLRRGSNGESLGADDGSVASATSDTAVAAGEVADALASSCYRGSKRRTTVIHCASSEGEDQDEDVLTNNDEKDRHDVVSIPTLTEAEKNSPLGVSMRLTWDLIRYMHGVIAEDRTTPEQGQPFGKKSGNEINNCGNHKANLALRASLHTFSNESSTLPLDTSACAWVSPDINHQNNDNGRHYNLGSVNPHLTVGMAANVPPPTTLMTTTAGNVMTMMSGAMGFEGIPVRMSNSFFPRSTTTNMSYDQQMYPS